MKKGKGKKYLIGSKVELAKIFGVAAQTIDKWEKRGMPGEPKKWPLLEVIPWWRERVLAEAKRAGEKSDPNMKLKRYRAELVRFELETRRQKYLPTADHLEFVGKLAKLFRNRLLSLAQNLGPQLRGLEPLAMDQKIKDRIWELLEDLSRNAGSDNAQEKKGQA